MKEEFMLTDEQWAEYIDRIFGWNVATTSRKDYMFSAKTKEGDYLFDFNEPLLLLTVAVVENAKAPVAKIRAIFEKDGIGCVIDKKDVKDKSIKCEYEFWLYRIEK